MEKGIPFPSQPGEGKCDETPYDHNGCDCCKRWEPWKKSSSSNGEGSPGQCTDEDKEITKGGAEMKQRERKRPFWDDQKNSKEPDEYPDHLPCRNRLSEEKTGWNGDKDGHYGNDPPRMNGSGIEESIGLE